jgi:hypothetical protein
VSQEYGRKWKKELQQLVLKQLELKGKLLIGLNLKQHKELIHKLLEKVLYLLDGVLRRS